MSNNEQQEMNIFVVMSKIGSGFILVIKWILQLFGSLLRLIYQYKYLFLICTIATFAWAIYESREENKVYKADLCLRLNDGDVMVYKDMIRNLNQFPMKNDYEGLANVLDLSLEVATKISSFQTHAVVDINRDSILDFIDYDDDVDLGDTVAFSVPNMLVITANVRGVDYFPEVQEALVSYFSKNNYLVSLNIARLAALEEKEWMFHNALMNLDSLQKVDYFHKSSASGQYLQFSSPSEKRDPFVTTKKQMYFNDMKELFKITDEISVDMAANLDIVTIITSFQPVKAERNTFLKNILYTSLIVYSIFLVLALLWKYKESVKEYLTKE